MREIKIPKNPPHSDVPIFSKEEAEEIKQRYRNLNLLSPSELLYIKEQKLKKKMNKIVEDGMLP